VHRPTATLRRLLILESLQDYITHEMVAVREQMRLDDLTIIDRKTHLQDIWIQYKSGHEFGEAIFMKKMLEAESKNRAKRTGMIS
jgi:negative regulator of genetic competence, sporulation and motility